MATWLMAGAIAVADAVAVAVEGVLCGMMSALAQTGFVQMDSRFNGIAGSSGFPD